MQIFSPFIISLLSVWCLYEENLQLYSAQFISLWFYDLWLQIHSLIFSSRIYYVFIFIFKSLIFLCEVGHQLSFLPDGFPVVSTSSIKWAIFTLWSTMMTLSHFHFPCVFGSLSTFSILFHGCMYLYNNAIEGSPCQSSG